MKKVTAIYVRRSVSDKGKDNNSLSIDSQIADCVKFLRKGEKYKLYQEDGKSAKNTKNRPVFTQMVEDAKEGLIERIVVKKYDRFSRSMKDYLNITDDLLEYGVHVHSLTENFDTTTDAGIMMRNNILNFAEYERKTIAARVMDAYHTKALETGFYQGGKVYYGYAPKRKTVNGKKGSVLVPSDKADVVRKAYEIYKEPKASLADIINHFKTEGVDVGVTKKNGEKSNMDRSHFSRLLQSPLYVMADMDVYQYLVSKGFDIVDEAEAFDGQHGLLRHKRQDGTEYIKVGYHEGLVDSETWLAVQDRKSHNRKIPNNGAAKNSWLVGIAKCGHCGYALNLMYGWNVNKTKQWRYYGDSGFYRADGCVKKRLKTRPEAVEQEVFNAMKARLESLEIAKKESARPDTETEEMKAKVVRIEAEIRDYVKQLLKADETLRGYIQEEVNRLDSDKSELEEAIRARARKKKVIDTGPLQDPISRWETLTIDEKHALATTMISVIHVSDESGIDIIFSI
jgi:DNA invertase Pin-like site-specific DNA recombinase